MGNCFNLTSPFSSLPCDSQLSSAMPSPSPPSQKRRRFAASSSCLIPSLPFSDLLLYDLGPILGRGQFGIIRRCVHRSSGVAFACKSIPKFRISSPQDLADVLREIDIMQHLSGHPHVVRLHHAFQDKVYVHLVMELCRGGELFERIMTKTRYSEAEAAALMKSLVETVKYCHSMGVMHRDLKPENILLADSSESSGIKIADFGLALRFSPGEKFSGMAGSAYYIAPEVLQGQYSEEIDIWSAGVVLYVLLSGMPPFWGETDQGILDAIKKGELEFCGDPWSEVSRSAKDLIRGMLCSDPRARLTATQVLEHPWILRLRQEAQNSQLTRALHKHLNHDHMTSEVSCYGQTRALSDAAEAPSLHVPTHRGYDVTPATPSSAHPVPALASISPVISSCPGSSPPDPAESKEEDAAQWSICSAPGTDASAQSPESQASDILGTSKVAEVDFNDFFLSLINILDSSPLPSSDSFTQIRIHNRCTCTLIQTSAKEQTLLVEMRQGKFLIVHDKLRKRIGWKLLEKQQCCLPDSRISPFSPVPGNKSLFQQSQPVF